MLQLFLPTKFLQGQMSQMTMTLRALAPHPSPHFEKVSIPGGNSPNFSQPLLFLQKRLIKPKDMLNINLVFSLEMFTTTLKIGSNWNTGCFFLSIKTLIFE